MITDLSGVVLLVARLIASIISCLFCGIKVKYFDFVKWVVFNSVNNLTFKQLGFLGFCGIFMICVIEDLRILSVWYIGGKFGLFGDSRR